jgi:hypothetical protein
MPSSHPVLLRLAPALLLFSSQGQPSKPAPDPARGGDALAKLVPEGTVVYVQALSLDRLGAAIRKTMGAFASGEAEKFDIDKMLGEMEMPGSAKEVDHGKPIAFCLVLPASPDAEPTPVFLVPALSPESFAKSLAGSGKPVTTAVEGGYVSVALSPGVKRGSGPAAIATGLPAADVAARIDAKRLIEQFRPMIDMGLEQLQSSMPAMPAQATGGMDVAQLMKAYMDAVRSVIDSAQTLDVVLRLDGDRLELTGALTVAEKSQLADLGSKEKTEAKALGRLVDPEAAFGGVYGLDAPALLKRFKPMMDGLFAVYPEPMRTAFKKMMEHADEFAAQCGSAACVNGDMSGSGMRYVCYLHPRDPAKLLSLYRTTMSSVPGLTVEEPKDDRIDGIPVTRMRVHVDAKSMAPAEAGAEFREMVEKLYGKDGLAVSFATKGELSALVIGGDDGYLKSCLARFSGGGKLPSGYERALEQVSDQNPCFAIQYNLGRVMRGMQELMGDSLPGGAMTPMLAATFTVSGGVEGRNLHGGFSVDLAELGTAVKAMTGEMSRPSDRRAEGARIHADLDAIRTAVLQYAIANGGKFPDSLEILVVPDVHGAKYLERAEVPKDPWGRKYRYEPPTPGQPVGRVYSYGKDDAPGGDGEDADVSMDISVGKKA